MTTAPDVRAARLARVTATAVGLLLVAAALYATELSRATAVAIVPFAMVLVGAALFARQTGRWPARIWILTFGGLVLAALLYAVWLYVYGLSHPPMAT